MHVKLHCSVAYIDVMVSYHSPYSKGSYSNKFSFVKTIGIYFMPMVETDADPNIGI